MTTGQQPRISAWPNSGTWIDERDAIAAAIFRLERALAPYLEDDHCDEDCARCVAEEAMAALRDVRPVLRPGHREDDAGPQGTQAADATGAGGMSEELSVDAIAAVLRYHDGDFSMGPFGPIQCSRCGPVPSLIRHQAEVVTAALRAKP